MHLPWLENLSDQTIGAYLWPDTKTAIGRRTAIAHGVFASIGLSIIYGFSILKILVFGGPTPQALDGFVDLNLYTTILLSMHLLCFGTAIFYIWAIGYRQKRASIFLLFLWLSLEFFGMAFAPWTPMTFIYGALLYLSINALRWKPL